MTVTFLANNARPVPGYSSGYRAGVDWARHYAPGADVNGFPACENVQESGFPSDDYAAGYWHGVWSTWCAEHVDCLATHRCRQQIREATEEIRLHDSLQRTTGDPT